VDQLLRQEQADLGEYDLATLYQLSGGSVGQGLVQLEEGGLQSLLTLTAMFEN
jgi:hypothetical protein